MSYVSTFLGLASSALTYCGRALASSSHVVLLYRIKDRLR